MKPRLFDLFCCAGGAGTGYHRAGFEVVGMDIEPQPRYPFRFVQDDALEILRLFGGYGPPGQGGSRFDAIHASPPCQDHMRSRMRQQNEHGTGWLLAETRRLLEATGLPWVIENVPGRRCGPTSVSAAACSAWMSCGSAGLRQAGERSIFARRATILIRSSTRCGPSTARGTASTAGYLPVTR